MRSRFRFDAPTRWRETVVMRRTRVVVAGRVQGVFFRASCAERARTLGLAGWVRNDPDGRVGAVFEGSEEAVETMIRWCHVGPPHARVDEVEIVEETPEGEAGFRVR
jgi:acylphosphatase